MFQVQVYSNRAYRTVYTYATWGAANSRRRFVSGKVRVRNAATKEIWV